MAEPAVHGKAARTGFDPVSQDPPEAMAAPPPRAGFERWGRPVPRAAGARLD